MQTTPRIWRHFDIWLLAAVVILTIAGVAMIQSAIGGNVNLAENVTRQTIFAGIGLIVVIAAAAVDYRMWSALARPIYIITVALLGLIFIAGQVGFGSARWFNVGVANIQPSELAKILMILVLADFLSRPRNENQNLRTIFSSLLLMGVPAVLVLIQPDLSTAIVLMVLWLALLWASGLPMKYIGIFLAIGLIVFAIAAPFLFQYFTVEYPQGEDFFFLRNYQMQRIANFLFPNPEESYGSTYNVEQSLISIGSGGWFGQGYGYGTQVQLRFLKVRHTDFIFSALAEEFGFAGAALFLIILMLVIIRCLRAARIARDKFGALISYGVAFLILFQSAFNVGMNLNLFPVSGIPLPFFSYGGSSLLVLLLGIGLVESVILRHKKIEL
ncbi:MAG: FtsW/RodA/SpoVE family cell cycle protein [Anaerolineales bacterium]|nr:FtsW/RodA/SpoVE family cell cycle protein [Anaerolineales bacterium]